MVHKGTIIIETERLILRRFRAADAEAMFRNWASDAKVTKYLTWPTHSDMSVSEAVLESWLPLYENTDYYCWAIVRKENDAPIGSISVVELSEDINQVSVGYCIGRDFWGKGYTSEALIALVKFFFEEVGANRIEARHDCRNPNSGKVMQKAGMRYEGLLRQAARNNQGICDAVQYAILAEDYFKEKKFPL